MVVGFASWLRRWKISVLSQRLQAQNSTFYSPTHIQTNCARLGLVALDLNNHYVCKFAVTVYSQSLKLTSVA